MLLSERHNSCVQGKEEEEDKTVTTRFISTNDKGKQSRQEKENTAVWMDILGREVKLL